IDRGRYCMKNNKFRNILSISTVLLLSSVATAQAEYTGLYFGAGVGSYKINGHSSDRVLKTLVGFQFSDFFGIEGAWTDFNRSNNGGDRFEADGQGVVAVLSFPIGIFVKGGQFWWSSDAVLSNTSQSSHGNDLLWGAGFKFSFSDHVALRVEAERYDVLNSHLNTYTAGLDFRF
ncbi:MAG TPA: outer membrane beta-barrel protein, partial [Methylotenera sp.]|nr:outer membrane beta-barrel protein [Methylotenera sp.]